MNALFTSSPVAALTTVADRLESPLRPRRRRPAAALSRRELIGRSKQSRHVRRCGRGSCGPDG